MIIAITGRPGSGKSKLARTLSEQLGYKVHSVGAIIRDIAIQKAMSLEELNKINAQTHEFDHLVDEYQKKLVEENDSFILDSRIGWFFIPHAIKIFLDIDPIVAAERILKVKQQGKRPEQYIKDIHEAILLTKQREEEDAVRFKKLYDLTLDDPSQFDLIINTTHLLPHETAERALLFLEEKRKEEKKS